jgi:hypothetical protein
MADSNFVYTHTHADLSENATPDIFLQFFQKCAQPAAAP